MYYNNPIFDDQDHHLIAWVGQLSVKELEEYLDEPGNRFDEEPHSEFSRELGRWYDHDLIWAEASNNPVPIRVLAEENGIDDEELVQELEKYSKDIEPINCFIILWNAKLIRKLESDLAGGKLKCIGSWPHQSMLTY